MSFWSDIDPSKSISNAFSNHGQALLTGGMIGAPIINALAPNGFFDGQLNQDKLIKDAALAAIIASGGSAMSGGSAGATAGADAGMSAGAQTPLWGGQTGAYGGNIGAQAPMWGGQTGAYDVGSTAAIDAADPVLNGGKAGLSNYQKFKSGLDMAQGLLGNKNQNAQPGLLAPQIQYPQLHFLQNNLQKFAQYQPTMDTRLPAIQSQVRLLQGK